MKKYPDIVLQVKILNIFSKMAIKMIYAKQINATIGFCKKSAKLTGNLLITKLRCKNLDQ